MCSSARNRVVRHALEVRIARSVVSRPGAHGGSARLPPVVDSARRPPGECKVEIAPGEYKVEIAIAWTIVEIPLAYGMFNAVKTALQLFSG